MRKRSIWVYILIICLVFNGASAFLSPTIASASANVEVIVSPNGSGSDCTLSNPCSLQDGRNKVRTLNNNMNADIIVYLRGGTYALSDSFQLTAEDSGTNGFDIYYKAYPGETPVLSGGITLTGWSLHDSELGIYRTEVPATLETRQLYVNGVRAIRAKGGALPGAVKTETGYTTTDQSMASWRNPDDIEFVFRKLWMESRCGVSSITGGNITMDQPCFTAVNGRGVIVDNPTWIENAYELLDEEGEWYLDRTEHFLYYKPRAGENINSAEVVVPVLETLVKGVGTLDAPIKNIVFEGLTFAHATWLQPNGPLGYREIQANIMPPHDWRNSFHAYDDLKVPANVTISGGHNIRFERNIFEHLGAVGLNIDYGAKNNQIQGNIFRDISGNAIMLGDLKEADYLPGDERRLVSGNEIKNNFITKIGAEYHGSVGIWVGYTQNTTVAHNELTDLPYSGISIGWGWGEVDEGGYYNYPTPTTMENNRILNNKIWNVMHTVIDGAGIYSLSASRNQLIAGNVIHDVHTHGAIYLDNKSRYNTVTNNVSFDITDSYHLFLNDNRGNTLFAYNFWDETAPLYDNTTYVDGRKPLYVGNQFAENTSYLPASIINAAGLEPAYKGLNPSPAKTDVEPPTAPAGLTLTAISDNSATLEWSASTDNQAVTGYEIWRDGKVVGITRGTSFRAANLHPNQTYEFAVVARDAELNVSVPSSILSVTTSEDTLLDNLALNKKVIVTYESQEGREADMHNGHGAEKAVDGNLVTTAAATGEYAWQLQVDLESVQNIDRIVVDMHNQLYATEYDIRVSNDGINFTTIKSVTGSSGGRKEHILTTTVQARYVRVVAIKPDGPNQAGIQMQIQELEVYNNQSAVNLALKKPARAFYIGGSYVSPGTREAVMHNGHEPARAVDGDRDTTAAATGEFAWQLQVDLGTVQDIDKIVVDMHAQLYATDYVIWASDDGIYFTKIKTVTGSSGGRNEHKLTTTKQARYVRIGAIKPDGPNQPGVQMQIQELEVYNNNSPVNLALNKPAKAFYNNYSYLTTKAQGYEAIVDDDPASYAEPPTQVGWNATVDLGAVTSFNRINVYMPETAHASKFIVEASADGQSYTLVQNVEGFNGGAHVIYSPQQARYVRITPAAGQHMALSEIGIYNSSNMAFGRSAAALNADGSAATMLAGHEANKANDGNPSTSAQSSGADPWLWQVNLGSIQKVNKIHLLLKQVQNLSKDATLVISTSLDGENFTDRVEGTTITSGNWQTIGFAVQDAQYIRVSPKWVDNSSAAEMALNEVEVYYENEVALTGKTTDSTDTNRYLYQQISEKPYILQAGDVLEYDVMLLTSASGIGGIDLLTSDGKRLKDQTDAYDNWHISANPASDLSPKGVNTWLKREIPIPALMQGRTVAAWLLGMENDQPQAQFEVKYKNLLIRNAYGKVTLRIDMDNRYPIEEGFIQGYERDTTVKSVGLNKNKLKLVSGDVETLVANVIPSYAANQQVTWSSSNPLVASVDQNGVVTAKQQGSAVITVTTVEGGYSASAEITVQYRMVLSENYALKKPAAAYYIDEVSGQRVVSTTHPGHEPGKANDGDNETFSVSNQSYAWSWEVDLGENKSINLVKGHMHEINHATEFEVLGSVDGQSYQVLGHVENFIGGAYEVRFPAQELRYIELKALKPDGPGQPGNQMALSEVGVYHETLDAARILETNAIFDRNPQKSGDVEVTLILNGHTLTGVFNGGAELVADQDYSITNDVLKLKKSYLTGLSGAEAVFSFVYDIGANSSFTVTLVDTTPNPEPGSESGSGSGPSTTPRPEPGSESTTESKPKPNPESNSESTSTTNPKPQVKLTDIPATHWAASAIAKAVHLGIITGYSDGTFRPNKEVTRVEFAAMLARALKLEGKWDGSAFADSNKIPAWAKDYVSETVNAGIITGYVDGTFRAEQQVTRTEMTTMIARALGLPTNATVKLKFTDADQISSWARPYVAALFEAGLIKGRDNNKFAPQAKATRAEVVVLIMAMLEYKG